MSIKNDPPMDTDISDLYQSTRDEGPSVDIDAAILAQAEAAVTPKRKRPAWIAPVGLAATLFLGVNLAVNLKDYSSAPDVYSESAQSSSILSDRPEQQIAAEPVATSVDSEKDYASNAPEFGANDRLASVLGKKQEAVGFSENALATPSDNQPADSALATADRDALLQGGSSPLKASSPAERLKQFEANSDAMKRIEGISEFANRSDDAFEQESAELEATNSAVVSQPQPVQPELAAAALTDKPPAAANPRPQPRKIQSADPSTNASMEATPGVAAPAPVMAAATEVEAAPALTLAVPAPVTAAPTIGEAASVPVMPSSAPVETAPAPVMATPSRVTTTPAQAPAPVAMQSAAEPDATNSTGSSDDLEEVLVTGSRIPRHRQSSNARLTAKDQSTRYSRQGRYDPNADTTSSAVAGVESEPNVEKPAHYECDLENLWIGTDEIESAVVDARNVEPPLNAISWPDYIRSLADQDDYVAACTQLAAFERLYPDFALASPLPLTIPKPK